MESTLPNVDSLTLLSALQDAGWVIAGQSARAMRLIQPSWPSAPPLLIPRYDDAPDADELLSAAVEALEAFGPAATGQLLNFIDMRTKVGLRDSIRFRKETSAPSGLIPWPEGQELIEAARETLVAGAKASAERRPYFGSSFSSFARQYLDSCYMGQTTVGSYVVTALTPINPPFEVAASKAHPSDAPNGRSITQNLCNAIEATVEAVEHYKSTKSRSAFIEGISSGVSVELIRGLTAIAQGASESTITIEWSSAVDTLFHSEPQKVFLFEPSDLPALAAGQVSLTERAQESEVVTVTGRVHYLTQAESDGPGVVGLDTGFGKYRIRLERSDYLRAVRAHEDEEILKVTGRLSREGSLNWLYDSQFETDSGGADGTERPKLFEQDKLL